MADMDRKKRRKVEQEVAYFIPRYAQSFACFGMLGHHYSFSKTDPVRVDLGCDIEMFRGKEQVAETDSNGQPLQELPNGVPAPLSYAKTVPSVPSPHDKETETLTSDVKSKKKKKGSMSEDPETEEDDESSEDEVTEETEEEKEEKPKKKKKKKDKRKKKKKKKPEPEEDDDEEDED